MVASVFLYPLLFPSPSHFPLSPTLAIMATKEITEKSSTAPDAAHCPPSPPSSADEKPTVQTAENVHTPRHEHQDISTGHDRSLAPRYTKAEEDAVVRKLDWHLMPLIFVLYSLSVLDRSNLGNARISGMEDDIDLSGNRYDWLGTAFYISCMYLIIPLPLIQISSPDSPT